MIQNLIQELTNLLSSNKFYSSPDGILKNKLIEDGFKNEPQLLTLLLSNENLKNHFFTQLENNLLVFNSLKFQQFLSLKDFLPDSYTAFKNKIGLTVDGDYLSQNKSVVLDFPFKDCVLEGGQSKDDTKRKEIFWNEILAPDEIDVLLEPKILTNVKKYTSKGEEQVAEFNRNSEGLITDNLIIKGNNLIALHSLKKEFKGKVKLIYIDPPYNTGSDSFGYNDKFNHSTWLVFMKNRLEVARELLRDDGVIFVQCDDNEQAYLKVLMDEVFEQDNLVNTICVKMSHLSGVKMSHGNKKLPKIKEYLHSYSKSKKFNINSVFQKSDYKKVLDRYNSFIVKDLEDPENLEKWTVISLNESFVKNNIVIGVSEERFIIENAKLIFRTARNKAESIMSLPNDNTFRKITTSTGLEKIVYKREEVIFASNKLQDGDFSQAIGDIWFDIGINNLHNEGEVDFNNGKKPEKLLQRVIEMSTNPGDIVLDYHLGSGTTCAVAHKMERQYIGIEQMDYIETISVERLKNVIGKSEISKDLLKTQITADFDNGGISKSVDWQGGGEFVYCELKQHNQAFVEAIQSAINIKELSKIWHDIQATGFLSYKVDLKIIDKNITEFESLSLEDGQRFLTEVLDKNMLYVNYSDIDNADYPTIEEEKSVNKSFYSKKR